LPCCTKEQTARGEEQHGKKIAEQHKTNR
jgi:hypothetical protein